MRTTKANKTKSRAGRRKVEEGAALWAKISALTAQLDAVDSILGLTIDDPPTSRIRAIEHLQKALSDLVADQNEGDR
jgi:hypothetical protein